jgi:RNA polymerase sigma-B factor
MSVDVDCRPGVRVLDSAVREQATVEALRRRRGPGCPAVERDRLRDQVLRWNLSFAHRLARRYRDRGENLDDLQQVAALALLKAVDGYDPDRGTSFTAYARPTIVGEIKRHFRDRVWSVHMPRQLQERSLDVTRARADLVQRLQRTPSTSEVAAVLGVTAEEVQTTAASTSAYRSDSLNRRVGFDDDACERQDLLGGLDASLEAVNDRVTLEAALSQLPERARRVVQRYFFDNRTQDQIALELGTSQMTVSRLLAQTLAQLRSQLTPHRGTCHDEPSPAPVRTYEAERSSLVAAVTESSATVESVPHWRDTLIRLIVRRRPRTLVLDLRTVQESSAGMIRALVDVYRACGHTGSRFCVVNVPPGLYAALRASGVTRLFACRMRTAPTTAEDGRTTSAATPPPAVPQRSRCAGRPALRPAVVAHTGPAGRRSVHRPLAACARFRIADRHPPARSAGVAACRSPLAPPCRSPGLVRLPARGHVGRPRPPPRLAPLVLGAFVGSVASGRVPPASPRATSGRRVRETAALAVEAVL